MTTKTKSAVSSKVKKSATPVRTTKSPRSTKPTKATNGSLAQLEAQELPRTPPGSNDEFLLHIDVLSKRVEEYVVFMRTVELMPGTSQEAKRKALEQFYTRLHSMEQELGRIKEELQLG